MILSRLNEISEGCEKILPVSGSTLKTLNYFKMITILVESFRNLH